MHIQIFDFKNLAYACLTYNFEICWQDFPITLLTYMRNFQLNSILTIKLHFIKVAKSNACITLLITNQSHL